MPPEAEVTTTPVPEKTAEPTPETTTTPATEQKPEATVESKPTDTTEEKPAEPEAPVPLTAEALKFPEGMEAPEELSGKFLELANKHGLSAEVANDLINLQSEAMKAASEKSSALWQQVQEQWQADARKEFGDKLDPSLADVRKLLDEYGSPELDEVFDLTGAGNHVQMVKFLKKIADTIGVEGKPVPVGQPATNAADQAHRLYPTMT